MTSIPKEGERVPRDYTGDYKATIEPCEGFAGSKWEWSIVPGDNTKDLSQAWYELNRAQRDRELSTSGQTMTKWGARRQAKRALHKWARLLRRDELREEVHA
jgi:hypothetical protein